VCAAEDVPEWLKLSQNLSEQFDKLKTIGLCSQVIQLPDVCRVDFLSEEYDRSKRCRHAKLGDHCKRYDHSRQVTTILCQNSNSNNMIALSHFYFFTPQPQTPQRRLWLLAALRKQIETTSIFSATPDGRRRTRPIRAGTAFNQ